MSHHRQRFFEVLLALEQTSWLLLYNPKEKNLRSMQQLKDEIPNYECCRNMPLIDSSEGQQCYKHAFKCKGNESVFLFIDNVAIGEYLRKLTCVDTRAFLQHSTILVTTRKLDVTNIFRLVTQEWTLILEALEKGKKIKGKKANVISVTRVYTRIFLYDCLFFKGYVVEAKGLRTLEEAALTLEEAALSLEEAALTLEEAALSFEEATLTLEGAALTLEEAALSLEEAALTLEEAALSLEEAALSLEEAGALSLEEAALSFEVTRLSL